MSGKEGVYSVIKLRQLAIKSGIAYQRLYENLNHRYDTLDQNEKTNLANIILEETRDLFKYLGFRQEIHRIKDPNPPKRVPRPLI